MTFRTKVLRLRNKFNLSVNQIANRLNTEPPLVVAALEFIPVFHEDGSLKFSEDAFKHVNKLYQEMEYSYKLISEALGINIMDVASYADIVRGISSCPDDYRYVLPENVIEVKAPYEEEILRIPGSNSRRQQDAGMKDREVRDEF